MVSLTTPPTSADVVAPAKRATTRRGSGRLWALLFALPAVAALGFGFVYPLLTVLRNSLFAGSTVHSTFVGFSNFEILFGDPTFMTSLTNNLKLLLTVPIMTVGALFIALVLQDRFRGWKFYRGVVFVPYILPAAGIGLAFSVFLQLNGGLNEALRSIGLGALALDWLGSQDLSIWSVGGVLVWQQLGFGIVIFSAALLSLPAELTEAARLDGASWLRLQFSVHIPQIRRTIEFFVVTEVITVLSWVFTYVYVLTAGGPANSSSVMEFYIWKNGFAQGGVGLANAAAVVVLVVASLFIAVYLKLQYKPSEGGSVF
jgi:ABC-type sugar transport system permease subunit